jgi:hypothetical protein
MALHAGRRNCRRSGCSASFQKLRSCRWDHQAAPQQLAHRPPRRSRVPEQRQSASGGRLALDHLTPENVVRSIEPLDDLLVIPGSALRSGSPTCRCGIGNRIACSRMAPDPPRNANLESASRGVLLRWLLWFSASRGGTRCDRANGVGDRKAPLQGRPDQPTSPTPADAKHWSSRFTARCGTGCHRTSRSTPV